MNETRDDETHPAFALQPVPDFEPLPGKTRLALEWAGARFAEIDPETGECVAVGEAG